MMNKLKYILSRSKFIVFIASIMISNLLSTQPVLARVTFEPPPGRNGFAAIEDENEFAKNLGELINFAQITINGFIGVGLMISVLGWVKTAFLLAKSNPKNRKDALHNIIVLTGTTAALGAFSILFKLIIILSQ